ncbi:HAD family hydrolase [Streptomyces sp. NK15101]|uniref:HAD family hydrolase n=1 Tax=Streptomyces sp. NK15101 TaxID=2873261 RepID=UPI001CEC06BC|nr:HAD family hydrolase [Streptomyces sp. NK15101]
MPDFRAVLFDWVGTLVVPKWGPVSGGPKGAHWIERTLLRLGREASEAEVLRLSAALSEANRLPDVARGWSDASADAHRAGYTRWVRAAGIDPVLADALYATLSDPFGNPFATDVAPTLAALKAAGLKVAVVSDIHFDIRPAFVKAGLDAHVDCYALSFEHGLCKPDPAFFGVALDRLGVRPDETLMVGDRSGPDGGAVEAGLATLLLPPLTGTAEERLHLVLGACGLAVAGASAR